MITPRQTRLIRVADLHEFRRVIAALCAEAPAVAPPDRFVVVPTRAAGSTLTRTLDGRAVAADRRPVMVTRDELYDALHLRLSNPPRRLTSFERDAVAQAAARQAALECGDLPFRVRPGLVAEVLRFYDQLRRQSQLVKRFEELISDALGVEHPEDRGADRLLHQTRFLAATFRGYEHRVVAAGGVDEHLLRERLLSSTLTAPVQHVVVTVPDWIADPAGLFVADFDLLNRLPNLAAIDIVSTEATLASGFHERLHTWWPGIEEITAGDMLGADARVRPMLACPEPGDGVAPLWFTHRDREEELIAVARRLAVSEQNALDRTVVVFKQPLPYLYLAADTLGAAGIPFATADALPLAAEPTAAVVDLVLDAIEADFSREPLIALLRSPHLDLGSRVSRAAVSALDRELSEARYLGQSERLTMLVAKWADAGQIPSGRHSEAARRARALPALDVAADCVRELSAIKAGLSASQQLVALLSFLDAHLIPVNVDDPLADRESRARGAVLTILRGLADAHAAHHDPEWTIIDLATSIRRWIADETFAIARGDHGVRLIDDQAARYGDFDDMTIVGLIENEWPDRSRRNVFYPPGLLRALNWPSEKDRRAAADARFLDLLASPDRHIELSTFLLDDEAIVSRSIQLDEVARARLSTVTRNEVRLKPDPTRDPDTYVGSGFSRTYADRDVGSGFSQINPDGDVGSGFSRTYADRDVGSGFSRTSPDDDRWFALRRARTSPADAQFHGAAGARPAKVWSVSAVETYLNCPFKFFAQHVLRLEEEPDDEEVMDPRRQGQFVHSVFETFFLEWQAAGHHAITPSNLPLARERFTAVVDRALESLPEGEAALERTRLLGSPAMAGLGEAVFRMEAERVEPVVERLLEHSLSGPITIETTAGPRTIDLRGKADRLDLLADGTFRLIDYKLGWAPDRTLALQLPIYAIAAEQRLHTRGQTWRLGEAMYLAFKEPKRVVPLFAREATRADMLASAQQRLADALDGIARGDFPPTPDDVFRCEQCTFAAVCRKDYVGDI